MVVLNEQTKIDSFIKGYTISLAENKSITKESHELPKGWKWVKLEDVCWINKEKRDPTKETPDEYFLYIDISSVEEGTGRILRVKKILGKEAPSRARRVVHTDDVIMSTVRPYLKSFAIIPKKFDNQICSTGFAVLTSKGNVLPKYLLYVLFSNLVIHQCNNMMVGAHYPALRIDQVARIRIPLPPIDEQRRIVSRLEQLIGRVEEAKSLRKAAKEETEKIMQAALNKIFSKAEKENWKRVKIKEVVKEFQSGFPCSKKFLTESGIPHLRPNNIGFFGELDLSQLVLIPPEMVNLEKYSLKKGDVLFNNTNSKELVGRACIVKEDLNYGFSNHITRLRVNQEIIIPEWLAWNINYLWLKGYFLEICRKWIGQAGVNTKMLKSTKIFLPPIDEQKKMVQYLDKIKATIKSLKVVQQKTEEEFKELVPAILDKAFRGELIAYDKRS